MIKEFLKEEKTKKISLQQAQDGHMFGPVYHGTLTNTLKKIDDEGFKIFVGDAKEGNISNGYPYSDYYNGIPAPIHHLGFGIYFTTVKNIAKDFAYDKNNNLKAYFLDTKNILEINFGANSTMMKWWIENGYDPELAKKDRVAATKKLTDNLSNKYDAVWFKGKGLKRLLDGDQICVYNLDIIKEIDKKLTNKYEIGSTVIANQDIYKIEDKPEFGIVLKGTKGILLGKREIKPEYKKFHNNEENWVRIKWKKGGTFEVYESKINYV